ncbi:TonB-dependent receptor plug domain-containing protein [Steroidobacter agaridevorans]|uniref:TonB-dependent receptor plug domain-containing protein n=1 Tax=Steroidobacter agaridevorans TaxID=2695856 RepID=UPI00132663E0|nr:TonB-dependent receptor [Steroidobacter agaridevorans]GFE91003.1 TonB system transporter [Steroidobacter agaridevorans]
MPFSRWHVPSTLAIVLLCGWAPLSWALDDSTSNEYELNISAGLLIEAIKQFSQQTDVQFTVDMQATEVDFLRTQGFRARLSARAALARILEGSGLATEWQGDHTVRIYPGIVRPHGESGEREVEVTGTRLRGGEGPAPIRVYNREQIDRMGVSSLSGMATYLTQQPFSFGQFVQRSGAQHFQLRGLGVDTTLVLINGRRVSPSATSVSLNAFDLNMIPLTAVERIEIMSDSASAIYGSDAIGGVANIILKEAGAGPDVHLHYGGAAGGAEERRIAGSLGTSGQRFRSSLTLDYFDRSALVGAERELWRNQDFRRFGGKDYRITAAPRANIYSLTGALLSGLPTSQASVPVGSTGVGLRSEDFLATAGEVSYYSSRETASVDLDLKQLSAIGSAELSLGARSVMFGEMLISTSDIVNQNALPAVTGQVVAAENPFNPFGEPVRADFSLTGTKPLSQETGARFSRFVLGARGGLSSWDWELALTSSDESADVTVGDLDLARVEAALRSTDAQTALNPFADGPAGGDALLSSLVRDQKYGYSSRAWLLSGFLRGSLFRMPGGMSELVAGGEVRREEVKTVDMSPLKQERDIVSEFAELKLPLLKELSLKLALRADFYEHAEDSVNPQYGLVWRPSPDWLVRAAYGTSFRPPSLAELSFPRSVLQFPLADLRRGGSISPVWLIVGGNPGLENVAAHSFTTGVAYRDSDRPGLHWGAHYWRVVMDNRIILPGALNVEKLKEVPGRVTRSAPTEADRLVGWPGALQSIDISLLNYGRLETSGIDLDLSHRTTTSLGRLQLALSATWVDEYSSKDFAPLATSDRVGVANYLGTIPEWRLIGSLTWEGNGWGVSTTATFTPSYQDSDLTGALDRSLPSRTVIDLQTWLELDRFFDPACFDGMKITGGAVNLFDEDVDFANAGLMFGFDISQADLKQRFAYFRITKSF